jgi:hypothetical protein
LLGLNCVLALAILPSRAVLAAHLTVRPQTLARIVEGVLNLLLAVWLTARFGLAGTVVSTSLAALSTSFWYLPRLTLRVLGSDWRLPRDLRARIGFFVAAVLFAAWLGRAAAGSLAGYPGAIAGALLTAAGGLLLLWATLLDPWAKTRLMDWARSILVGIPGVAAPLGATSSVAE